MTKKTNSINILSRLSLLLAAILFSSCATDPASKKGATWEDTLLASNSYIDYSTPAKYLEQGELTAISPVYVEQIGSGMRVAVDTQDTWKIIAGIYGYMLDARNFQGSAEGGRLIAKRTVDRIFADKTLTGCHDFGIVLAASLRAFGIPAIYLDTASVPWAVAYSGGNTNIPYEGHIFVEAYVKGKWIVLNSTAPEAVTDYDPANPLLGFTVYRSDRYYVMFKGKDPLDYGVHGNEDVTAAMRKASRTMALSEKGADSPKPVAIASLAYNTGNGKLMILGPQEPEGQPAGDTTGTARRTHSGKRNGHQRANNEVQDHQWRRGCHLRQNRRHLEDRHKQTEYCDVREIGLQTGSMG